MIVHSLNLSRTEDMPEIIRLRSLREACAALRQIECTPLLEAYVAEASTIESLRTADEVSRNVAVIVVMAWNAHRRLHGQEPANDAGEAPKG